MLRRVRTLIRHTCCSGYFFTKATVGDRTEQLECLMVCHPYCSVLWWYTLGRTEWSGPYFWDIYRETGCIEQIESCFCNGPDLKRWLSSPSDFLTAFCLNASQATKPCLGSLPISGFTLIMLNSKKIL